MKGFVFILFAFILPLGISCNRQPVEVSNEPILASVGSYNLYESEIQAYLTNATTKEDTQQIIRTVVENWVRDHLMITEAERNQPNTDELNKLVEDYRKSLLLFYYEKRLTEQLIDTVVTDADVADYFETHKNNYTLGEDIIRCRFIKIKNPIEEGGLVRSWWTTNDSSAQSSLVEYCGVHAETYVLELDSWIKAQEVQQFIPTNVLEIDNARTGQQRELQSDGYTYFFELVELREKGSIPPIEYVRNRLERFILYERKQAFLQDLKENLLEKALSSKEAKIFIE